ncbi:hypothetical protein Tco_0463082 [Tanacetum coccineum]
MVACLEKTEGNFNFHEIVDFLASSLINHSLTVSLPIYTSYIEQFWNTASSQTVNDVKQINATVDSKAVVVTEASIRSSLLFNDAHGTACLTNEAIFQNIALMARTPLNLNPHLLLSSYLVQENNPPDYLSSHATTQDSRDSLEGTNGNEGDQVQTPHDSPLSGGHTSNRAEGAQLSIQKRFGKKESVSKQGRKKSKLESTLDDSTVFDDQDADHGGNAEELVSTARPEVSTARPDIDAARQEASAVEPRTPPKTTSIFDDEDITMAQTLIKMKEEKAKEKEILKDKSKGFEGGHQLAEIEREREGKTDTASSIVDYIAVIEEVHKMKIMIDKIEQRRAGMDEEEVHILALEDGTEIHMLAERRYPLIRETLKRMMELRLTVEFEDIKNWLVQKQTAFGKDFSNPFIADSLLKTIRFSTHHASHAPCYSNEALAIPEQTATGKEISNPFMAGSLPKTT